MIEKNFIIQFLRFFFVLIIVTYNFPIDSVLYKNSIIVNINLYITFFFVLSSYLLCEKLKERNIDFSFFKQFIKKKILRLYPIHFMFLMIFSLIEILKIFFILEFNYDAIYKNYTLTEFFLNLFFLNGFELSPHTFNQPSWTVSLLIFLLSFYCFLYLFNKKFVIWISAIISIATFYFLITNYSYDFMYKYRNILLIFSFSITQFLCLYISSIQLSRIIRYIFYTIIIFSIFYLINFYKDLATPFIYFLLILFIFKNTSKLNNNLNKLNNICVYLGNISFIWYVSHYFFTFTTRQILKIIFNYKINLSDNTIIFGNGSEFITIFVVFISLIFSIIFYEINKNFFNNKFGNFS